MIPAAGWVGPLSYFAVAGTMAVIGLVLWMKGRQA
jgi:hypothetical protein